MIGHLNGFYFTLNHSFQHLSIASIPIISVATANATPIPEPADCVDKDGSNSVDTGVVMHTQVSPFDHDGPAKHIQEPPDDGGGGDRAGHILQVPPDHGGGSGDGGDDGGGGGNRAGHTQIPVGRADGNKASLIRQRIPKVGGADKISGKKLTIFVSLCVLHFEEVDQLLSTIAN